MCAQQLYLAICFFLIERKTNSHIFLLNHLLSRVCQTKIFVMRKFDEKNIERRVKFNEAKKEYTIKTNKQTKVHNGIIVKSKNEEENFVCTIIFFISY